MDGREAISLRLAWHPGHARCLGVATLVDKEDD